jgi:hypothetical protein
MSGPTHDVDYSYIIACSCIPICFDGVVLLREAFHVWFLRVQKNLCINAETHSRVDLVMSLRPS